jgi:hypothetical protein
MHPIKPHLTTGLTGCGISLHAVSRSVGSMKNDKIKYGI